jgi:hypothetical protein
VGATEVEEESDNKKEENPSITDIILKLRPSYRFMPLGCQEKTNIGPEFTTELLSFVVQARLLKPDDPTFNLYIDFPISFGTSKQQCRAYFC